MLRFRTVRAKLTALVGFTAAVTLVSIAVLSWLMHRQLLDEADDRVPEAIVGFDVEAEDDLRDLGLVMDALASRAATVHAFENSDAAAARDLAKPFNDAYPDVDVAFFDAAGKLFAQVGLASPPDDLGTVLDGLPTSNGVTRGLSRRGCEHPSADAPPGYVIARRISGGALVACMPIDEKYLVNARSKLGVELALIANGKVLESTDRFPHDLLPTLGEEPELGGSSDKYWALAWFDPKPLAVPGDPYRMAMSLDVTDIRAVVLRHLTLAGVVLMLAALVSVAMGGQLASVMSRALARISNAQKNLEQQQYVHVDAVKTGDEIEDLATGFNTMVDGLKERDKLRTTFGKYMTEVVLEHLLSGKVQLGGEMLRVTILFSDIRSFTTISERMNAKELVSLLNEYFTEMVTIIMAEDGVVDKYIGDAIMAVFGAPVPKADDAVRAVRAAVRMRKALAELNVRLTARGAPALETGIGIHTGDVVAGNIGSEARMEYTVIGDAVNLASRLETSTKELHAPVVISEDTYALVKDAFETRPIRETVVKGRAAPVMTYEVLRERT